MRLLFQGTDQRGKPVLGDEGIVVEEHDIAAARSLDADIVSFTEVAVDRQPQQMKVAYELAELLEVGRRAAVVDDDDLVSPAGACHLTIDVANLLRHVCGFVIRRDHD